MAICGALTLESCIIWSYRISIEVRIDFLIVNFSTIESAGTGRTSFGFFYGNLWRSSRLSPFSFSISSSLNARIKIYHVLISGHKIWHIPSMELNYCVRRLAQFHIYSFRSFFLFSTRLCEDIFFIGKSIDINLVETKKWSGCNYLVHSKTAQFSSVTFSQYIFDDFSLLFHFADEK